jgi:hypothetical protein
MATTYQVKKEYQGKLIEVHMNDEDMNGKLPKFINLDIAGQKELEYLYAQGHCMVERTEKQEKQPKE